MTPKFDHSRFRAEPFDVQSAEVLTELKGLSVATRQEEFGGTFAATLEEWQAADKTFVHGLIFFFDQAPAGCVLLKHPPASPDWVQHGDISIHGLKIDYRFQGLGLGGLAFATTRAAAKTRWPHARRISLAVDAENAAALKLYKRHGMQEIEPPVQGRIGYEYRLGCTLK